MKAKLLLLFTLFCMAASAQNLVNINAFSVPKPVPANTADWGNLPSLIVIANATGQGNTAMLEESKVAFTIKSNGNKVCGGSLVQAGFNGKSKIFKANEISGMFNGFVLKPGTYQLCVQFFTSYNGQTRPISDEKCSNAEFVIEATGGSATQTNVSYTPPQNISPANEKVLTAIEAKQPLTFRWTPLVPKPRSQVTYKLKVWQLMQGQNGTQAMKTTQPFIDEEVKDQTQYAYRKGWDGWPKNTSAIWRIEATDGEGKVLGESEPTGFSFGGGNNKIMAAGCQMDFKIISGTCEKGPNGTSVYTYCANLQDISTVAGTTMYFNDPLTFNCVNGTLTGCSSTSLTDLIKSPNGTIAYIGTYPNTIPKVGGIIVCFKYTPTSASATTALFKAFGVCATGIGTAANASGSATPDTTVTLPPCPCTFCDQYKDWQFQQQTEPTYSNTAPYQISLSTTITAPSVNIKSFKAELISFAQNGSEECFGCNKDDQSYGNITSGTFGAWGNGVFPLYGSATTHHTINWFGTPGTTLSMAGQPITLNISTPPFNPLTCCDDEIQICIRYSFTTADCQTCSYVKCYTVTRKHK